MLTLMLVLGGVVVGFVGGVLVTKANQKGTDKLINKVKDRID